jgi:hypothetical protein
MKVAGEIETYKGGLGDTAMQRAWMRYADEQEVPHDHEDEEAFKYGFNANAEQSLNIRRAAEAVVNHFYRYDNCTCGVPVSLHGSLTSCCLSSNGSAELAVLKRALEGK